MKTWRNFYDRSQNQQRWLTENTWCAVCGEADLGLTSPGEYEQNGRIFIEGRCSKCGALISSEIIVRAAVAITI